MGKGTLKALLSFTFVHLLLTGTLHAQQLPRPARAPYYECKHEQRFSLPFPKYNPPIMYYPKQPKRAHQPWPEVNGGREIIYAYATAEADGTISSLQLDWMQSGLLGWPQVSRADLDRIALHFSFGRGRVRSWPNNQYRPDQQMPRTSFDPTLVQVEVSALEVEKLKHPMMLFLRRAYDFNSRFGGLADVPAWLLSASIFTSWPEFKTFMKDAPYLEFELSKLVYRDKGHYTDRVRGGRIETAGLDLVIENFQKAEVELQNLARQGKEKCRKMTQPVDEDQIQVVH